MKHSLPPMFILLLFLVMLGNPSLCIQAAGEGLKLWYSQVLPALFPSMILTSLIIRSNLLTSVLTGSRILRRLPIMHILPLLSGLLCGYPIGAKTCRDLHATGELTETEIKHLTCFVHCPSPMFMLGYVSTICLPAVNPVQLLLSVYLPIAALIPLSLRVCSHPLISGINNTASSVSLEIRPRRITFSMELFDEVYNKSVQILIKIAGYLMLFTIINRLLSQLFPQASVVLTPLSGILEMTYGIRFVTSQPLTSIVKETMTVFFLGFGGLSTMLQVRDALPDGMFYPTFYLCFRILHGMFAVIAYHLLALILP